MSPPGLGLLIPGNVSVSSRRSHQKLTKLEKEGLEGHKRLRTQSWAEGRLVLRRDRELARIQPNMTPCLIPISRPEDAHPHSKQLVPRLRCSRHQNQARREWNHVERPRRHLLGHGFSSSLWHPWSPQPRDGHHGKHGPPRSQDKDRFCHPAEKPDPALQGK